MSINAASSALTNLADPAKGAPSWTTYLSLGLASLSVVVVVANFLRTHFRERRKDRYEYAEKVAAWTGPDVGDDETGYQYTSVVVHNGSAQPIYDVVVSVRMVEPGELPGETDIVNVAVGLVPPDQHVDYRIGYIGQVQDFYAKPLSVYFVDGRGINWRRNQKGQLRRIRGQVRLIRGEPRPVGETTAA